MMWDQSGYSNAGGFMEEGLGGGTQSATPGGEKRKRAQNLVPIKINDIIQADEDGIKMEGREVGMVDIVGRIKSVEQTATKTVYVVDDNTGTIEAVHWTDSDAGTGSESTAAAVSEGMHGRVIGSVRSQQGTKHVMAFRILPLASEAEIDSHRLECEYAKLKLRQLNEKENRAIGANMNGGLSNSMVGVGGSAGMGANAMNTSSFSNTKHESVFKILSGCNREEGLSRDEMMQMLKGKISRKDLDDTLEFLSGEGHIYSTTDEDHFKTTDG